MRWSPTNCEKLRLKWYPLNKTAQRSIDPGLTSICMIHVYTQAHIHAYTDTHIRICSIHTQTRMHRHTVLHWYIHASMHYVHAYITYLANLSHPGPEIFAAKKSQGADVPQKICSIRRSWSRWWLRRGWGCLGRIWFKEWPHGSAMWAMCHGQRMNWMLFIYPYLGDGRQSINRHYIYILYAP